MSDTTTTVFRDEQSVLVIGDVLEPEDKKKLFVQIVSVDGVEHGQRTIWMTKREARLLARMLLERAP